MKLDNGSTTLREWLASRIPPPQPRLAARLDAAVADVADSRDQIPQSLVEAACAVLRDTLDQSNTARNGAAALDLLAVDALITYAVEAAAEDCEHFAALTDDMIARVSVVAGDSGARPR